ncbi:MAG: MBL fold metallo-hydrolase [Anaerolineales bacterium]
MAELQREVVRFETRGGAQIFQIPLQGFPGFWVYAYVVQVGEMMVLIDTGTNFYHSNQDLVNGFARVSEMLGETVSPETLTHIFITHGHIDHYAGLAYLAPKTQAKIGVHDLDYRNLTNYQERKGLVSERLERFLLQAGVSQERTSALIEMYMLTQELFEESRIDFTYQQVGMQVGPLQFFHTPGHRAGAVVIRLGNVLFAGDHILSKITPHQAPERLTLNTGLSHYLPSLQAVAAWADGVELVLGGHNWPVQDLHGRVAEIMQEHKLRLEKILGLIQEKPQTIEEISRALFGTVEGYNVLLALEETGAHIEYLYRYGFLAVENFEEVKEGSEPDVLIYRILRNPDDFELIFPKLV